MAPKSALKPTTGKRKRETKPPPPPRKRNSANTTLQIITGSYERVLHGFVVSIPNTLLDSSSTSNSTTTPDVRITDNFLFNAHASAIRCLALSSSSRPIPTAPPRRMLATGSTDARINLYQISASAPRRPAASTQPSLLPLSVAGAVANKEIGTLSHHESAITALSFPSRAKLLSASVDNTIAVTRTHDWVALTSFKAPIPKTAGRPSGDTAMPGEVPAGINDFAVHPSQLLMMSVGQGEKSLRLWNLMTGRKAGVLDFKRPLLSAVGAGRWRGGEGRRVVWSGDGEEFAVAFERGVVVYGLDLTVKGVARVGGKICEARYLRRGVGNVLAVSTEDGRVVFFGTDEESLGEVEGVEAKGEPDVAAFKPLAHLGPLPAHGTRGSRIKDFIILTPFEPAQLDTSSTADEITTDVPIPAVYHIVTATSEGSVKIWALGASELDLDATKGDGADGKSKSNGKSSVDGRSGVEDAGKEVGELVGSYETGRRVTCLEGFVMEEDFEDEVEDNGAKAVKDGGIESVVEGAVNEATETNGVEEEFGGFSDDE